MGVAAQSAQPRVRSTTWDNLCYVTLLWYRTSYGACYSVSCAISALATDRTENGF